ncbi:MAG: peptidoglycan DD-metalloendopeptidase family protein [bacterium]
MYNHHRLQTGPLHYFSSHKKAILIVAGLLVLIAWLLPDSQPEQNTQAGPESQHSSHKLVLPAPPQSASSAQITATSSPLLSNKQSTIPVPQKKQAQTFPYLKQLASLFDLTSNTVKIKSGDTLESVFLKQGLTRKQLQELLDALPEKKQLSALRPGQKLIFYFDKNKQWLGLDSHLNLWNILHIYSLNQSYSAQLETIQPEIKVQSTSGTIQNNLFLAGQRAGLSDSSIMQLANIFGWDVDFALDIRPGDHFEVIYEKIFRRGIYVKNGDILAASFTNRGDSYQAVRFTDPKGDTDYYAPDGRRMRKAFLRTPVEFTRISSRFTYKRKHPILKGVTRPHRAIDYAAPKGTPVRATGDGKVVFSGRARQLGNYVKIQHANKYVTIYAHLSKFSKAGHKGNRVKQGQIIGYVGMTGLATAPHLHYEFRVNGVHKDPTKIKFPKAKPLPKNYMVEFEAKAKPLLEQLQSNKMLVTTPAPLETTTSHAE